MVTPGKVILQAVMRYCEDCQLPGEGLFRSCCRVVVVGGGVVWQLQVFTLGRGKERREKKQDLQRGAYSVRERQA